MLNFLLGYIVGSASSQPAVPATPMSPEEAAVCAFIGLGLVMLLVGFGRRFLKRSL
jgi:hypothetical protein